DPTFWNNDGIDLATPGAGQTTLTQGLAKRLYFHPFKPGFEKLELMLIAKFALTPLASKPDILHAALAVAYLGTDEQADIIGFAQGARHYYGRELSQLTDDEFLSLVAMLMAPNALDPKHHAAANAERVARIKRLLAGACVPKSWRDVALEGCALARAANYQTALMPSRRCGPSFLERAIDRRGKDCRPHRMRS
ncbi:MAG: transglycosylase domain-containing protein, partial [Alphaproteobacteria bacterium]